MGKVPYDRKRVYHDKRKITVKINPEGWLSFYNQRGELLTAEYWRNRNRINRYAVPIGVAGRELKPITGTSDFALTARFEAYDDEKIYGMGQYQEKNLNKKGAVLELEHRNSQASVPFMVSSRGYGFSGITRRSERLPLGQTKRNGMQGLPKRWTISLPQEIRPQKFWSSTAPLPDELP